MGLLTKEQELLSEFDSALMWAEYSLKQVQNWIIGIVNNDPEQEEPDVLELLARYARAASAMDYIEDLGERQRERVINSLSEIDFKELIARLGSLEGMIEAMDKTDAELLESTIDRQLMERLEKWKKYLTYFKPDDESLDDPSEPAMDYLMTDRDLLEYAKIGIQLIKVRIPRFKDVKNLKILTAELEEADKVLRKILGKRRQLVYWADPLLWWRHE